MRQLPCPESSLQLGNRLDSSGLCLEQCHDQLRLYKALTWFEAALFFNLRKRLLLALDKIF